MRLAAGFGAQIMVDRGGGKRNGGRRRGPFQPFCKGHEKAGGIAAAGDRDQNMGGLAKRREKAVGSDLGCLDCHSGAARNQQASRFSSLATLVTTALEAFG